MEGGGGEDSSCLPPDLWMSQVEPPYGAAGSLGTPSLGDARAMNSQPHIDLSRKQTPLYNNYDAASRQQYSVWEFAAQNFSQAPKDFTSQNVSLHTTNTTTGYSQPLGDFPSQHVSQPVRSFPPSHHNTSQSQTSYTSQSIPQPIREPTSQAISQTTAADRSVWAHLYSLDPSIASYGVNNHADQSVMYPQEKVYAYTRPYPQRTDTFVPDQSTGVRGSVPPVKPPLINSSELMAASFMNPTSVSAQNVSIPSSSPSIYANVSGGTSNIPKHLPADDFGDHLGGYSPVSPPTRDSSSPYLAPNSGLNAPHAMLKPDNPSASSSTLCRFPSNTSPPLMSQMIRNDSDLLSLAHDVPLDMTKGWSLPDTPATTSGPISMSGPSSYRDIPPTQSIVTNTDSGISSLDLSKSALVTAQPADNTPAVVNQAANFSQNKALKKSNFYGRDASFFSLTENSTQLQPSVSDGNRMSNDNLQSVDNRMDTGLPSTQRGTNFVLPQIPGNSQTENKIVSKIESFEPNFESTESNFADSFIDASTAPYTDSTNDHKSDDILNLADHNTDRVDTRVGPVLMETDETDILQSQVRAVRELKHGSSLSKELSDGVKKEMAEAGNVLNSEYVCDFRMEASTVLVRPTIVASGRGRGARGRKKRGGAVSRRGAKKGGNQPLGLVGDLTSSVMDPVITPGIASFETEAAAPTDFTSTPPITITIPKPARGRKKKAKVTDATATAVGQDSDPSSTRRSSNRRSKDNAMRLIELQAESIYNHVVAKPEPQETPQPPPGRARRKAAKAAMQHTFNENLSEEEGVNAQEDSLSEDTGDEKDMDYAVDEEDVASLAKDEQLDIALNQKNKAVIGEKKLGGLKISIKLSSDSSAEIVSGIDKSPPRKKRKTAVKKKIGKAKFKSKSIILNDDTDEEEDEIVKKIDSEASVGESQSGVSEVKSGKKKVTINTKPEPEEKVGIVDKHNSLMDKYFSSVNSAAGPRPKSQPLKKEKLKQDSATVKSKATKNIKNGTGNGKDSSAKTNQEKDKSVAADSGQSTQDKGVPKFVCGYCPKKYHDKHTLLSHMETHMAEMEDVDKKTPGENISKEPKKPLTGTANKKPDSVSGKQAVRKVEKKSQGLEDAVYNCGECGKTFSSKPELLDHVRSHTSEKPFECNLCHKCFKERDQLSVHRKVHIQEGLIRCSVCSKGFVNNADLTSHMDSHPKRSKPGQSMPQPKVSTLSEPIKKISKPQNASSDKDAVPTKPKSFASALEPQLEKNKEHSTILLRRIDGSAKVPKEDPASKSGKFIKPSHPPKQEESVRKQPPAATMKAEDGKLKESKPPLGEKKSPSALESKIEVKEEDDTSGECKCKECPECVTRFLSSFD